MNYTLKIKGNTWEKEIEIDGDDFMDIAEQVKWIAEYEHAIICSLTIIPQ